MLQDHSRNRTPMPGAQAPAATPPDAGAPRAEAGIAAMLSAEAPLALPAQMLIESDPIFAVIRECEGLEAACTAEYAKGNDGNSTPEQSDAAAAVWGHVTGPLSETVPTTAAGCVALARFIPSLFARWGASLDGEQAHALFRLIERSPACALPGPVPMATAELPAPGSPEAVAAFSAACRAVDRAAFADEAERKALKIGSGLQYWTSEVVEAARLGNFTRIMPRDIEAAKATLPARLRELLVLALRRELRMAEAEQASRLCELHALAYPDDQEEAADTAPTGDAVHLAIEAHRAARAALTASCNPADSVWVEQNGGDTSDAAMAPARAIHEAASDAETDAWDALLETRPSDADGLLRMLRYLAGAGPMEVLGDAREFGRNIAEAAEVALRLPTASPALTAMVKEWHILTGAINAKGNSDEEVERIGEKLDAVQTAIYEFPAASLADLVAKVPVFQDELYDATNGLSEGFEPRETLAGAAWLGLFRDFARLAGGAATAGGEEQATDPIHALIAEHRAAYAEWDRATTVWDDLAPDSPEYDAAKAAQATCSDRECALMDTLIAARPVTLAGIAALAEYLPGALRQVDPNDHEPDSEVALRNIAASLRALGGVGLPDAGLAAALLDRRAKAGEFLDLMQHDGFVPYPADAPRCLMAIDLAIPLEAERLLGIAQAEFDRLADAYVNFPPAEREAHLTRMRAEYRLDELAAAVRGRATEAQLSLVDQILDGWRAWGARPDLDESEAGQAEFDRLSEMRNALIDAAEALPATTENILPKALACAWLDYVQLWGHGLTREDYGSDGRLALDIDTAICGRLKTRYAGVAA